MLLASACLPILAAAQVSPTPEAIFNKHEFDAKHLGPARWIDKGAEYTTPRTVSHRSQSQHIVAYTTLTGKRTVLVSAGERRTKSFTSSVAAAMASCLREARPSTLAMSAGRLPELAMHTEIFAIRRLTRGDSVFKLTRTGQKLGSKVAKSDCAADISPDCKSLPSCWNSLSYS